MCVSETYCSQLLHEFLLAVVGQKLPVHAESPEDGLEATANFREVVDDVPLPQAVRRGTRRSSSMSFGSFGSPPIIEAQPSGPKLKTASKSGKLQTANRLTRGVKANFKGSTRTLERGVLLSKDRRTKENGEAAELKKSVKGKLQHFLTRRVQANPQCNLLASKPKVMREFEDTLTWKEKKLAKSFQENQTYRELASVAHKRVSKKVLGWRQNQLIREKKKLNALMCKFAKK